MNPKDIHEHSHFVEMVKQELKGQNDTYGYLDGNDRLREIISMVKDVRTNSQKLITDVRDNNFFILNFSQYSILPSPRPGKMGYTSQWRFL